MAKILCLETSTKVCSVCIAMDGQAKFISEFDSDGYSHAEKLNVLIAECMDTAGLAFSELDAIAVSKGPGSYTGLRIGVSAAKGFAFAQNIPLISVNSLRSLASQVLDKTDDHLFIPMIDARRMEVYAAGFSGSGREVFPTRAEIVEHDSFPECQRFNQVYIFGDGAEKCWETLNSRGVTLIDLKASAVGMAEIAEQKLLQKDFEDTAYFEPYYLKDFVAGPKKK